jgi:hypothetical protein
MERKVKLFVVKALTWLCGVVDVIAYRPAVVKATLFFPSWWTCHFAHASMKLDQRWNLHYWDSDEAPAVPNGPCDACKRRAAWMTVGGLEPGEIPDDETTYLELNPVQLCGWCDLRFQSPPKNQEELTKALHDAASRSIAWRWRWDRRGD